MTKSSLKDDAVAALKSWYETHRPSIKREPERYVVCAGLAVLELMLKKFPLGRDDYITEKNQVRTSGPLIKKILSRYGEMRIYAKEGARTTRGTVPAAESLVARLNALKGIKKLPETERTALILELQGWLVERANEYFQRKTIEVEIRLDKPGPQIVSDILNVAKTRNQMGPVAQHLVGAKLALRYLHFDIENHSYTTADTQTGRGGDFLIHDTVFHVTVAPMPPVIDKCVENIRNGYRAILLVPELQVPVGRAMAENHGIQDQVGVQSLESFIGQNIEELSEFGKASLAAHFRLLIEKYNERVAAVETDRSLLIDLPENL